MLTIWKTPVIILVLLALPFFSPAQNQVVGMVTDADGNPLPAATVLLLNSTDSSLVKGQLSSVDGSFRITDAPSGTHRLSVSMLGFSDYYTEPFVLEKESGSKDLGKLILAEDATRIGEVSIVAKRPLFEQRIDRLVVNVATSITSAGSNALQVLQRSPGVLVNRAANAISMSGKSGVVIMINGKISRMPEAALLQLLESMNADNIERIELVHTPPADFDAEGNAGIINIILKKSADDGYNGNLSAYAGYGFREKLGASTNFNYRKNRINLYGDYAWTYNNNPQVFTNYRSFTKGGTLYETDSYSDRDPTKTHVHNARLGLDLQLGSKTVLGGLVGWLNRDWKMEALNTVRLLENGQLASRIDIPNEETNQWRHWLGNLNLSHEITPGQKINLDLDYAYYYFNNPSSYTNRFFDANGTFLEETRLQVLKTTPMGIFAGKADYTRTFGDNISLESGVKATMTRFDNDVRVENRVQGEWVPDPVFSSDLQMEEDINAVYSTVAVKLSAKTDLKAGLRYEYTRSNLGSPTEPDIVDRKYGNLFPSLFLSHQLNKDHALQLSYSRRINRPSFMQLAPFFIFYDPTTVLTGNPQLQPGITDAVQANYRWKSIQLSLQYSYEDNAIVQWQPTVDTENNRQINGALNYDYATTASATLSLPFQPAMWWETQTSVTVQRQNFQPTSQIDALPTAQFSWYGFASQTFHLPKKFSLEISGYYYSSGPFGILTFKPMGELNLGLQKDMGPHGTLSLNASDLLFTGNWTSAVEDPAQPFRYKGLYRFSERAVRLTYSRSFGSNQVKSARNRTTSSEEERRRVGN